MSRLSLLLLAAVIAAPALAADRVHIASSSTVAPFISLSAEQFGHGGAGFEAPVVESMGSGGGLKLFCASLADGSPDIAGASRRITEDERKNCAASGVSEITEIAIGYDGIVLAAAKSSPHLALTQRQLFLAIARTVPRGGKLVPNPYKSWHDIDPALPDEPIMVFGPAPNHGTRDVLAERLMGRVCDDVPEFAAIEPEARRVACRTVREDGAFVEVTADYNVTLHKLEAESAAVGFLPYSYLERNHDRIVAAPLDGKLPNPQAIRDGSYPLARPLYVYVKKAHLPTTRGLRQFVAELVSDKASGPDGYLAEIGLIALPEAQRKAEMGKAASFPTL